MDKKKYLTIPELAEILGVSRIAVYKAVKNGKIKAEKIGRNYIISDKDVVHLLRSELSKKDEQRINKAISKAINEYGNLFKQLSRE